jgi:sugar/nucleoside kinase (ribokinase family)
MASSVSPVQGTTFFFSANLSDTFSGVLLAHISAGQQLDDAVETAQKAAVMTLSSPHAVSDEVKQLKL